MSENLTVTDAGAALRAGKVTAVELMETAISRADAHDAELGVFIDRYVDSARAAAVQADADLAAGVDRGPLHGIPLGIKDIISTTEGPTTAQSLILDPAWGEQAGDAVVVSRLRSAGGIVVGKLSTMEYACGTPDSTKPFPIPRNPWDTAAWTGGSSSGTGSGVASGMFLAGLGTDTGGSIRIPSAYCGITGIKPTFGRVPKSGCVPLGYTLDNIGPMARSARDCAVLLGVLAGHHPSDPFAADRPVDDYETALTGDLTGIRIGVDRLTEASGDAIDPAQPGLFEAALAELAAAGAEIVDVTLPYYAEMFTVDFVTMLAEAAAYHQPDLTTRWTDYGAGTRYMIGSAALYTAADYVQAQRVRRVGQLALATLFENVDLIVTPTSTMPAPTLASLEPVWERTVFAGLHTPYWNSSGHPTASMPIGFTAGGLPLAMQISGRPWAEATVLAAADAFQARTDFHLREPALVSSLAVPVA
jgi:aspartyl-tRNA(Asn)/glutamyl-tRNA(Gln) amidotransferase subunit A